MSNPAEEPDVPEVEAEFEDPDADDLVGDYVTDPLIAEEDQ